MKISIVNINSVRSCYLFIFFQNSIFEQIGKTYNFSFAPGMKNESTTVPEGLGKSFLLQSFQDNLSRTIYGFLSFPWFCI